MIVKKLFQLVSNLTGTTKQKSLPEYSNPAELANDFANFFINKIKMIRDALDHHPTYKPSEATLSKYEKFREMLEDEVLMIIKKMPTKSCDLDTWEASLMKITFPRMIRAISNQASYLSQKEYLHHNGKELF